MIDGLHAFMTTNRAAFVAPDPLHALVDALESGRSTFAWALEHASAGDPLPALWDRCEDPFVMLCLAAHVRVAETSRALLEASTDERTYPHARDCLSSAARALGTGAIREAESWVNSAVVHFPGRGSARPQPEKGRAVSAAICDAIRKHVSLELALLSR
jgi:hypothetical protein